MLVIKLQCCGISPQMPSVALLTVNVVTKVNVTSAGVPGALMFVFCVV